MVNLAVTRRCPTAFREARSPDTVRQGDKADKTQDDRPGVCESYYSRRDIRHISRTTWNHELRKPHNRHHCNHRRKGSAHASHASSSLSLDTRPYLRPVTFRCVCKGACPNAKCTENWCIVTQINGAFAKTLRRKSLPNLVRSSQWRQFSSAPGCTQATLFHIKIVWTSLCFSHASLAPHLIVTSTGLHRYGRGMLEQSTTLYILRTCRVDRCLLHLAQLVSCTVVCSILRRRKTPYINASPLVSRLTRER